MEENKKTEKSVYQAMLCNNVLFKLYRQKLEFPIGLSYKIYKLRKQLDELEMMMDERWEALFGKDFCTGNFTDEQIALYNSTLQALVEIDTFGLSVDEIASNENAKLSIQDIEILGNFLN